MLFRLGCLTLPAFDSFFQCGPLITCVSSLGLEQARYYDTINILDLIWIQTTCLSDGIPERNQV